jgi:hypothetical protein
MPVEDERGKEQAGELSAGNTRLPGRVWQSSWGLRLGLGLVALLVWAGATSWSSAPPAVTGTPASPPVTTPVVAGGGPATPPATDPATTASLPQQTLDITYDYGPGPQPVPGVRPTP